MVFAVKGAAASRPHLLLATHRLPFADLCKPRPVSLCCRRSSRRCTRRAASSVLPAPHVLQQRQRPNSSVLSSCSTSDV